MALAQLYSGVHPASLLKQGLSGISAALQQPTVNPDLPTLALGLSSSSVFPTAHLCPPCAHTASSPRGALSRTLGLFLCTAPPCWTRTHKFFPPLLPQFRSLVSPTQCNHCLDSPSTHHSPKVPAGGVLAQPQHSSAPLSHSSAPLLSRPVLHCSLTSERTYFLYLAQFSSCSHVVNSRSCHGQVTGNGSLS